MKQYLFAVLTFAICAPLLTSVCLAARCTGQVPEHHAMTPFVFDTDSHVERSALLHFDVCIYNSDPKFYLRYAWFVPDWAGFAPPHDSVEGRHYPTNQKAPPIVLKSCIQYGNADALTTATFFGDEDEKQATNREDLSACQPVAPVKSAMTSDLQPINMTFRLFFPSDAKVPQTTMLALSARYSLEPSGAGYSSTINYELVRAPERPDGDPNQIVMKPILRGPAESLIGFLHDQNPSDSIRLGESGNTVLFQVPARGAWQLSQAALQFLDHSGVPVGRVQIPVFVPVQ